MRDDGEDDAGDRKAVRRTIKKKLTKSVGDRSSDVGYCRPPKEHQWKPNQSGNPKGRRKGVKNTDTLIREVMDQKHTVIIGGRRTQISHRNLLVRKTAEDALKDMKARAYLFSRYDGASASSEEADSDAYDKIIADFEAKIIAQQKNKTDE